MMYMTLPDGVPTSHLPSLVPHIINAEALPDDALTSLGVARCVVSRPDIEWYQTHGAPVINVAVRPVTIIYPVIDRDLESVKQMAWERIKRQRTERQDGLMPYTFPSGDVHHVAFNDKAKTDLAAQTTAALGMMVASIPGTLVWTVHENVTHSLTPSEMLMLGLTGGAWQSAIHTASQPIREAINAAATVAGVVSAAVWE